MADNNFINPNLLPKVLPNLDNVMISEFPTHLTPQDLQARGIPIGESKVPIPQLRVIPPSATENRMSQLVEEMPQQAQYAHPGKLRRLAAILSGVGAGVQQGGVAGPRAAREVLQQPYQQAMQEWSSKMNALSPLADLEMKRATLGESQYGHDVSRFSAMVRGLTTDEANKIREAHNKRLEELTQQSNQSRDAWYKGRIEQEKARLKQELDMLEKRLASDKELENIRQTGANKRASEHVAGANARAATAEEGRNKRMTAKTEKPPTAREEGQREQLEATRLIREHPDYTTFVKQEVVGNKPQFHILRMDEVKPEQQEAYKRFLNDLMVATKRQGAFTIEPLEDDEEDETQEEE